MNISIKPGPYCELGDSVRITIDEEKQVCAYYDDVNVCDCPYTRWDRLAVRCPPAEQILDTVLERVIEDERERRAIKEGVGYGKHV